jgi:cytochrome c-type biogenesis protein CcmE
MKRSFLKPIHLFGLGLIVAFGVYGITGIRSAITPYVSIKEAQATTDRVQVKGHLDKASMHTDNLGRLIFDLNDFTTHQVFTVVFSGQHPANMQMARDVVVMGSWDGKRGVFEADQMNIKCPDKYSSEKG